MLGWMVSVMEWMDSWWALLDEGVDGVSAHSERDGVGVREWMGLQRV